MKSSETKFIAELCQNHNGNFKNIEKMVYECASNGAKLIKLQNIFSNDLTFRPQFENGLITRKKIYSIKRPFKQEYDRLKKLEINYSELKKFIKLCHKNKEPAITCFTKNSKILKDLGFKTVKVASYDCASFSLIRDLSKHFKNIIVSTGATYDDEIEKTSKILKKSKTNFSLLHCVSIYPTPPKLFNLARINYLKKFSEIVGYSDHSLGNNNKKNLATLYSIFFGAKLIERHVTILNEKETKDGKVSINPKDIQEIISFSKMSKTKMSEYLSENYPINKRIIFGKKNRQMSHTEKLNRDYYRGRFATHDKNNNGRVIFNWEES